MRIAVYHNLPSGGAKRAVYEFISRLSNCHDIDVYTLSSADHDFCDIRPFVKKHHIFNFKPGRLFKSPFGRLNQFVRLVDLNRLYSLAKVIAIEIDREKYDLVFVQPCIYTKAPFLLRHMQQSTCYYIQEPLRSVYEPEIIRPYRNRDFRRMIDRFDPILWQYKKRIKEVDRVNTLSANSLLANSCFTAQNVQRIYGKEAYVSYLGVDACLFRPMMEVDNKGFLLSVGQIAPHKGFDTIIEAISLLPKSIRPELRLIGNASNLNEKIYLEQLALEKGINLVIETLVDQDTLVKRYNEAQFIVYTPIREPFGLVPLEAMACGKPVIGVKEGGVCETVVDGVTGSLVERDFLKIAMVIQEYLENPGDVQKLGAQAREYVLDNWTWEKSVSKLEKYFESILNYG